MHIQWKTIGAPDIIKNITTNSSNQDVHNGVKMKLRMSDRKSFFGIIETDYSLMLEKLNNHLKYINRFNITDELSKFVDEFILKIEKQGIENIAAGKKYYRARIHGAGVSKKFEPNEIWAPPKGKSSPGRMNPGGISYLYLAESKETAIAEVRPWKGAEISVGNFTLKSEIKLLKLLAPTSEVYSIDSANIASVIYRYFLAPISHHETEKYLASQFIVERIKNKYPSVNGVRYRSVQHDDGYNVVIFNDHEKILECTETTKEKIKSLSYELESN